MRGVLNVYKPGGVTSYDVIRRLKPVLPEAKIGHAGTLDPLAEGILLLLINEATKIAGYIMTQDKEYEAEVLLGLRTETDDITGKAVEERPVPNISDSRILSVLKEFHGIVRQMPPAYSALKVNGERAYRQARKGQNPGLRPRKVLINELSLVSVELPVFRIRVQASGGTYIRSLARDIGERLGTGGTLKSLVRTRSAGFRLDSAVPMESLDLRSVEKNLVPIKDALGFLPLLRLPESEMVELWQGKELNIRTRLPSGSIIRTVDDRDRMLIVTRLFKGCLFTERGIYSDIPVARPRAATE